MLISDHARSVPEVKAHYRVELVQPSSTAAALDGLTCGVVGGHKGSRLSVHVFVLTNESKAAAAVRIGAGTALRERGWLMESLRGCFARTQVWLQAGKYISALMSEVPERNGWAIARHCGGPRAG